MKTTAMKPWNRLRKWRFVNPVTKLVCAGLAMVLFEAGAGAGQLIWDPLLNGGTTSGSGNWDTNTANTNWYTGSGDVAWTQTGTNAGTMGAIFNGPDAAAGTYTVTLDSTWVAITNLAVNNNGYVFTGNNAIYIGSSEFLTVAANKTVTFNCNMAGSGTSPYWLLGSGATMNVGGGLQASQQLRIAGPSGSVVNMSGTNTPGIVFILTTVNVTNGSLIPNSSFYIGYTQTPPAPFNSTSYGTGVLTISGSSTVFTVNGNILIIGRSGGSGTLNVEDGVATVGNLTASRNLAIDYDGSAGSSAAVNVSGGTLTVGSSSQAANQIAFFQSGASVSTATATLTLTGGTINTYGGMEFGLGGGTGAASFTQSGGTLYVGNGITKGSSYTGPYSITLSGGTVGAIGNWSSSLPMTLTTTNGNITFQCTDSGSNPHTITLSGPLSGNGGLNMTGQSGTLDLTGANTYAGTTTVSNGTLIVATSGMSTNGPVLVDASTGSSTLEVQVGTPGQYWSIGNLTYSAGTPTSDFEFGALAPSTTVAPVQVSGSVAFTTTPFVTIGGSAIATGTYPLIKYTGGVSGVMPTTPEINLSGGSASGYLTNITGTKTISLVVTSSTYNPALSWAVGSGAWDINMTANWKQFGASAKYVDGDAVLFDDSASGPAPITVTLNTVVNPLDVTFNNAAPTNYTISGSGSISGSGTLSVLNSGTATLTGTNTYTGGTVVSAGQLNINNGGNASASAIGTGPLTINAGASLDNTSGTNVTLQANNSENWNGSFTYVGSANSLNTGSGSVTMNASLAISNGGNNFTVGGSISDGGNNYALSKTGSGTLTLAVGNAFGGGMNLESGLLNVGDPNAVGSGIFTITGGAIDNVNGAEIALSPSSTVWGASFTFLGTATNLDFLNQVNIPNGLGSITLNVANNMLVTYGDVANNNTTVYKSGSGTWQIAGAAHGAQSLGLVVTAGEVILNKFGGQAITGGNNVGMTVETGTLVVDSNNFQIHSDSPVPLPITLSGGTYDLNGFNENMDELFLSGGGTLKMGAAGGTSTLNLISGYTASLTGPCQFYVESNGVMTFQGPIGGSGSLVKTGAGTLNLISNNVYTGATVISNGTVALPAGGTIADTADINLATTNAALDLSSNNSPTFTLMSGQTLSGFGSVTGIVMTASGSMVAPGSPTTIGTLTIAGSNTLGGTTLMKLNKTGQTNDQLAVSGTLAYGGTLALSNISGTLANGDSFTLFSAGGGLSGSFASLSPTRPGYPEFGLAWNTNSLVSNGKVSVITAAIPPSPKITGITLSGTTLAIRGTNGLPNEPFVLLESTNAAAALTNWVSVLSTNFDGSGNFNVSVSTTNAPWEFFAIWEQ